MTFDLACQGQALYRRSSLPRATFPSALIRKRLTDQSAKEKIELAFDLVL